MEELFAAIADFLRRQRATANPNAPARLAVLAVAGAPGGVQAFVRVLAGRPRLGQRLQVAGTGQWWAIRRLASVREAAAREGGWSLLLAPIEHDRPLLVGAILEAG